MNLVVVDHPLVADRLVTLRDEATGPAEFRRVAAEIATFLTFEATRDLATGAVTVSSPLGAAEGRRMVDPLPIVVPILRAGLGLADALLAAIGGGDMAVVGIRRDEDTLEPGLYCETLPGSLAGRPAIVCDPMLATGGSAVLTIEMLAARGAGPITLVTLVAAPEGLKRIDEASVGVTVVCAAVDDHLDDRGYIFPGLGDAGDRLFGPRD
ncbi:MAG: uracil phosphoribosyltransferase [Acidimicrobiales bacterium]